MNRALRWFLLLALSAALAACGFQLRGQYSFDFDRITLRGLDNSEMQKNMDLQLQILDLKVNPASGAPLTLNLLRETRDRSIVTFSASGRAREVRITYELFYEVTDAKGEYLIATSQLSQRRELLYSDDQILGKEAEESRLYTEMQRDIARQIISRLSALQLGTQDGAAPTQNGRQ
ncbi:LPS assembly lipoprotein LptE [Limnobacter sp.]|uniref:LPS-assembly lipoprotein LptE n=1 Tax=Limnobacter sp. TaxID=2003368 RepID=UPI0035163274